MPSAFIRYIDTMETLHQIFVKAYNDHIEALELDKVKLQEFIDKIPETVPDIVTTMTELTLQTLKDTAPAMLIRRRSDISKYEKRIQKRWKSALDLFEMFLVIAYEVGENFNDTFREEACRQEDYVFDVMTRLHARGCQIGFEILTLFKSGFADAAHARWRTLHENAVVAFVISKHGQDIAERYSLHGHIESYKAMCQYQKHSSALHDEPFSTEDMDNAKKVYDALVVRFGPSFKGDYGWAAEALQTKEVRFSDIEMAAGMAHLRPYYRMASHNVHANVKGVTFKLGIAPQSVPVLLAGPSNYGFADPAHGAAISLSQITVALLSTRPNIDHLVAIKILQELQAEIGDEFLRIQVKLEGEVITK